MAEDKWNVKGLRGSVLEELITIQMKNTGNRNLLLCRKYQHRSNQSDLIRQNAISHLLILIRKVLLIISGSYRGFLFALMRKNVQKIYSHFRIFMNIR